MLFPEFGQLTSLTVMDYGLFRVHENGRLIGIQGYLLQTTNGKNILVDTGFPEKYASDPQKATLEDRLEAFGEVVALTAENMPLAQLAQMGLTIADVDLVVYTHSDIDHIGGLFHFAHLPIVIGQDDRAQEKPRYFNEAPFGWPEGNYILIDRDCDLIDGVRLFETPGHAPGHLSLLLTLPETGRVLLTGDAISRPAEVDEGFPGAWNPQLARQSAQRLLDIAAENDALIIYGHDPAQWPTLRKAPHSYY